MDEFNPDFVRDILTLLDRIETTTDDEDVIALAKERHAIAKRYGMQVIIYRNITSREQ